MVHRCGLLHLHQGNPVQKSACCGSLTVHIYSVLLVLTFTALSNLLSAQPLLPAFHFCVCKLDLFLSLSELIFCLVLLNDEKACSYIWPIPSYIERKSEHLPVSPNKGERQNMSSTIFLLECKVFNSKNAGCVWHCEKYARFHSRPIMEHTRLSEMIKAVCASKTDCFQLFTDFSRHSLIY